METSIRTFGGGWIEQLTYRLKMVIQIMIGQTLMSLGAKLAGVDWREYKSDVIDNSDCRKFDGILRMILSGNERQRQLLTDYLEGRHQTGELCYGMQVSSSSLITCLIFHRQGEHVHFVDGADGSYAMASIQLKQQLKQS